MTNSWIDDKISHGSLIRLKHKKGIWLFQNFEHRAKVREADFTCLYLGIITDKYGYRYIKILMDQILYIVVENYCFTEQETETMVQVEILASE